MSEYLTKYDIASEAGGSMLGQASGLLLGTATDIVTSLWNSIPLTPEIRTEDVLGMIDKDALHVYNENIDTVRTLSLVGGAVIPGGIGLKLLGRARAGVTQLGLSENFIGGSFAGTRQARLGQEIEVAFRESGEASKAYKSAKRELFASNITKEVIDNAVIELAVIGALNAHPYMEDYWKDPLTNFAIGTAFGSAIGLGFAIPSTRKFIMDRTGNIAVSALEDVAQSGYKKVDEAWTSAGKYQAYTANIKNLDAVLNDEARDGITKEFAGTFVAQERAAAARTITEAAPWLEKLTGDKLKEARKAVQDMLIDPKFIGVDKIKLFDFDERRIATETTKKATIVGKDRIERVMELNPGVDPDTLLKDLGMVAKDFITPEGKPAIAFTRLSTGEIFGMKGVRNAALAVDMKDLSKFLYVGDAKTATKELYLSPRSFGEDNLARGVSSSKADATTLREMKLLESADIFNYAGITIAPDYLPRMNALISKATNLSEADRASIKIRIRSDLPSYQQMERNITATVGPNHLKNIEAAAGTYPLLGNPKYTKEAEALMSSWIHGAPFWIRLGKYTDSNPSDYNAVVKDATNLVDDIDSGKRLTRRLFDNYFRNADIRDIRISEEVSRDIVRSIWESGEDFRNALRKHADADGNLRLYRGMDQPPHGALAVESFTTRPAVARGFGSQTLYAVPVDNIIAAFGKEGMGEYEIIVAPPHHQVVKGIDVETGATTQVKIAGAESEKGITIDELAAYHADETERQLEAMISVHMSAEEISARLNIKKDAIDAYLGGHRIKELVEYTGFDWRRYTDAAKIDSEYLSQQNRLYALVGNPVKNPHAESMAGLDARQSFVAHRQHVEETTLAHKSVIGNETLDIYNGETMQLQLDEVFKRVGELNNQLIGSPIWQSSDNALRRVVRSDTLTYIGNEIIRRQDVLRKKLLEPLASRFLAFKDKREALVEFNSVVNKLYGLSGWRDIEIDDINTGWARIIQKTEKGEITAVKNADGSEFTIKQASVVDTLRAMREPSNQLLQMHNLNRSLTGVAPLRDLGFYIPPMNLVNKNIAFVIDTTGNQPVQLLVASSGGELDSLMAAYKAENAGQIASGKINVVPKGMQEAYNDAKGYTDYESFFTYANVSYQHKGKASTPLLPPDNRFLENIMSGYENVLLNSMRKYSEIYLSDVTGWLDHLSAYYRKSVEGQPKLEHAKEGVKDSALFVKNTLLGRDNLEASPALKKINTLTDMLINKAVTGVNTVIRANSKMATKEYFEELVKKLREEGVDNPWKSYDEYFASTSPDYKNLSPTLISTGNGMLGLVSLRMFEMAQASVNIMSTPILTWSALMEKTPGTTVGMNGETVKFPLRTMYGGIRHWFSPEGRAMEKEWAEKGLNDLSVRQYTDTLGALKGASQGGEFVDRGMQALRDLQDSKAMKLISSPADFAEKFTRTFAMHVGAHAAKIAYPGIDRTGATIAALAFADRSLGNYHAAQKPTLFQGTLGSALGLFQTYFLTFAQHVYRGLEDRNFAQLASLGVLQTSLFGMSSWPGFQILSENVVSRFNDKNYDLTTGTFRALDKDMAELVLYGMPSSLGPAFYTRGDISPRIPSSMTEIAVVNGIKEGWLAAHRIVSKAAEGIGQGTPVNSLFEALSMQSLNRPIARWSELVTGSSVTQKENTVSPQNEVWTPVGVTARLLATRPLEEQVVRNARHLDSYYGTLDRDRRDGVVDKLRTAIRAGKLDQVDISDAALNYLRYGGSSKGWNSAINHLLSTADGGMRADMLRKLEPDSPIRHMISDMW